MSTLKTFESPYIKCNGGNDKSGTRLKVPYEIILLLADTFFEIGTTPILTKSQNPTIYRNVATRETLVEFCYLDGVGIVPILKKIFQVKKSKYFNLQNWYF